MSEKLKPCPFCGAEAVEFMAGTYTFDHGEGCFYDLESQRSIIVFPGEVEAWNQRAAVEPSDFSAAVHDGEVWHKERTCKMQASTVCKIFTVYRFDCCGFEFSDRNCDSGETERHVKFCPNCGARVVE